MRPVTVNGPVSEVVAEDRGERGDGDDRDDREGALGGENAASDRRRLTRESETKRLEQQLDEQEEQRLLGMLVDVGRSRRKQDRRVHLPGAARMRSASALVMGQVAASA
jgi:hypothetical protein